MSGTDISLRYLLFGEDKSATSTVSKVGGAFTKLGSQIGGEFGEILNKVGEGIDHMGEHAKTMGAKLTGAGAIIGGVGIAFQMAGSREAQGAAQLNAAIDATGRAHNDYKDQVEGAIKSNERFGFGAADTQQALMKLTAATNDPKIALQQMTTVANLAASQHIDLATAASMVARVYGGSGKVLKQYGIHMDSTKVATSQLRAAEKAHEGAITGLSKAQQHLTQLEQVDHAKKKLTIGDQIALRNAHQAVRLAQDKVRVTTDNLTKAQDKSKASTHYVQGAIDELGKRLNGQASASVDNFGGKIRVLKTRIGDWTAQMGQKLGPALTAAGPILMTFGTIMELVRARQVAAAAATDAETAAQSRGVIVTTVQAIRTGIVTAATGAWTAAQWALNVALNANPIALIIIGIVALIAVVILAYKHSQTFRNIVTGAFHAVLSAVSATWHWIASNWPLLLAILTGPVGLAVLWITRHWGGVTSFFRKVPGALGSALAGVADALTAPFRYAFNAIADLWNATIGAFHFTVPSWVPGLGGHGWSMPHMPHLAAGAIVNRPTVALLGESGREAVVPLTAGRGGFGGGGPSLTVNFNGPVVGNRAELGKLVTEAQVEFQRQQGGRPLPTHVSSAVAVGA